MHQARGSRRTARGWWLPYPPHVELTHCCLVCFGRRRPFLIRPLENTLVKLILSLEFYSQEGRQKIAIGAHLLSTGLVEHPCIIEATCPVNSLITVPL